MRKQLTAKFIDGVKPTDKLQIYVDAIVPNLRFLVHPTGRRVWRWYGRVNREHRSFTLGMFPAHSLQDARKWAANINDAKLGGMPLPVMSRAETLQAKLESQGKDEKSLRTCDWLFDLYMTEEGWRLASSGERRRVYEKDIKPFIGGKPIHQITHDDLAAILRAKKAAGAAIGSNNIQAILRRLFRWAVTMGRDLSGLHNDPAQHLVKLSPPRERSRFLTDYEIGIFFQSLNKIDEEFGEALIVGLYTGMRRSEFFELQWDEVNFVSRDIEISGARTKNGSALVQYMSDTVYGILKCRHERNRRFTYVWPASGSRSAIDERRSGESGEKGKPINTFSKNMKRLNEECHRLASADGKSFQKFSIHDLRRTLSSGMHALKDEKRRPIVASDIVERVLNHRIGEVRGVYNRYDYYVEKMNALNAWAEHLDAIKSMSKH